jgi:hypothetical protein
VEGHFPHLSAPDVVAEALLRHLPKDASTR